MPVLTNTEPEYAPEQMHDATEDHIVTDDPHICRGGHSFQLARILTEFSRSAVFPAGSVVDAMRKNALELISYTTTRCGRSWFA